MAIRRFESPFHAAEPKEVANALVLKTRFCAMIRDAIEERGWTQAEAAEALGVSQPRISNVVTGKIDKIRADALLELMFRLGFTYTTQDGGGGGNLSICIGRGPGA